MKKLFLLLMLAGRSLFAAEASLLERLNGGGPVIVATDGAYRPFNYHDEKDQLTGYDIEICRALFAKLGVQVEFKETLWDGMLAGLKSGRFDFVANQVTVQTPERRASFIPSLPYSYTGMVIVTRKDNQTIKDPSQIKGRKAAQTLNSNHTSFAEEQGAEILPVESLAQSLLAVEQGRADLTVNDSLALLDYLKMHPDSPLQISWTSPSAELVPAGLVAAKGQEEAMKKIDAALAELQKDGTLKAIGERFFGKDVSVKP